MFGPEPAGQDIEMPSPPAIGLDSSSKFVLQAPTPSRTIARTYSREDTVTQVHTLAGPNAGHL